MYLSKVEIKNYRLFEESELCLDGNVTLIVGRNNVGKTSCISLIEKAIKDNHLSFNDYPIFLRKKMFDMFSSFVKGDKKYEDLKKSIQEPSIKFVVNYALEKDDDNLGALSPFIIDLDESVHEVHILVKYEFSIREQDLQDLLGSIYNSEMGEAIDEGILNNFCMMNFNRMLTKNIYAVHPHDEMSLQGRSQDELEKLFPIYFISAERQLDEGLNKNQSSLSKLVSRLFDIDISKLGEEQKAKVQKFRSNILRLQNDIQINSYEQFNEVAHNMLKFGYPNAEDLSMKLQPRLNMQRLLKTNTMLTYASNDGHILPSSYSGLGYKNLIKISLELTSYVAELGLEPMPCIPLLVIEEPESHMHPQMQRVFVSHIEDFINDEKSDDVSNVQIIITTHSSHIANAVDFSRIRYVRKSDGKAEIIDLKGCNLLKPDFIKKYMTISQCDLYFADKVILVEGASERIILPDMIERLEKTEEFKEARKESKYSEKELFSSEYISIIEVGGAYAYVFQPLLNCLKIPYLILTDIDYVGEDRKKPKEFPSDFESCKTSNPTILNWFGNANNILELLNKTESDKTDNYAHIEYQVPEGGSNNTLGRSFEEALEKANPDIEVLKWNQQVSKVTHALKILQDEIDYQIPKYIKNGLTWLGSFSNKK